MRSGCYTAGMSDVSIDQGHHPLLEDLTEPQRQAVSTTEGPLLVMAAAGSGKTRVITRRVAWLIRECGIAPWNICAITFTNKAAGEMRQRIGGLLSERQARAVSIGTFHALCCRLLRQYADVIKVRPNFSIYDTADQKRVIKQAMEQQNVSTTNFKPDAVLGAISNAKNELISPGQYAADADDFFARVVARIYETYQEILARNGAVDFDDLLMKTANLLRRHEPVRRELQQRFTYLLIDEYQDTNHAQFVIAEQIARGTQNICVVGDPDQSIYGWRGANIRNILDFEQHFPEATVVALGQNYRSTPQILHAADTLIRRNKQRRHKPLFTENPAGHNIRLVCTSDEEHEARLVVDWLREHEQAGMRWADMVIFYRVNALSRVLEDALMGAGIPYQIARGTAFYDRKEVRDAIAYLRVLNNGDDEIALLRIINQPTRGIGKTTIEQMQAFARANSMSLWQVVEQPSRCTALNSRAVASVQKFAGMIHKWQDKLNTAEQTLVYQPGVRDLVEMVIRASGLEKHYEKEDKEKADNLYELISAAQRFDDEYGEENADLATRLFDYLESIALVSDQDAINTSAGAVTLMTLHAAKGLEFPVVAMVGLEDGLLPHSRSRDDPQQMEEERRLLFVGITRAQRDLMLTHARYRTIRGQRERTIASPFLKELPRDVVDEQDVSGFGGGFDDGLDDRRESDALGPSRRASAGRSASSAAPPRRGRGTAELPAGSRVRHPQFGPGKVLSVCGAGSNARAKVHFDRAGVKTLILEYARLERET